MLIKNEVRELLAVLEYFLWASMCFTQFFWIEHFVIDFLVDVKTLQNAKWPKSGATKSM